MPKFNVNGVNMYYEVKGNENSKDVIAFFNGVMASTESWKLQIPIFERLGFKIVLHDFKGQMLSDKPQGPYSFREHADEAKALFEQLGVDRLHIVGTSYGGEVAMKFAILYPAMVKSISIINSVSEVDEVIKGFVMGWRALADFNDGEKFFWGMVPTIYGNDFIEGNREFLQLRGNKARGLSREYFEGQKTLYDTFLQDVYMTDELRNIFCPTLVVCGQDDLLKRPKFSKLIADNIPNSEYVLIPDCGHVTIFERAETLNSILLGFILKNNTKGR